MAKIEIEVGHLVKLFNVLTKLESNLDEGKSILTESELHEAVTYTVTGLGTFMADENIHPDTTCDRS